MRDKTTHLSLQHYFHVVFIDNRDTIVAYYASWKAISPSKLLSNGHTVFQIIIKGDAHT